MHNSFIRHKEMKMLLMAVLLLLVMLLLGGCSSTELEQRSFPLAVGIDLQEGNGEKLAVSFDFPDLKQISEESKTTDTPESLALEGVDMYHVEKSYENNTNRLLDYTHMKAVVLGENLFVNEDGSGADTSQLRKLLSSWEQRESSARNTSLFIGDESAAKILSLTEETEGSVGKYLEEMLESQKDFKQNKMVTVGNLMNQWHNQDELLLIPVLTEQGERPVITGYAAISNFEYRGSLTVEQAMEVYFTQNLLEKFTCEPVENEVVEISDIQVQKTIEEENEVPVVTLEITGKGRYESGQSISLSEQYRLEQEIQEALSLELTETAQTLRDDYGIDMTNSFISLGGYNRKLYEKYEGLPNTYGQEARQVFHVDITLLNWQ